MAESPESAEGRGRVSLRGLTKRYGNVTAVDGLDLEVTPGSFTTLLGPSGCGKTTALRMIAGFVEPDAGTVSVGGRDVTFVPPDKRGVGMVFQDYALFPHLSVRRNVEYGLRARRVPANQRRERVDRTLAALDLSGQGDRYPHQLSGGQQQRVALGRVMVLEPEVLLLDEPLSNLDAQLRVRLRSELKELQNRLGVTAIYVTHDQEEALSLSDRVVVMDAGRVEQVGSPEDVYRLPATVFVARFVGQANLLPVTAVGPGAKGYVRADWDGREFDLRLPDDRVPVPGSSGLAVLRPERVTLRTASVEGSVDGPFMSGTVQGIEYFGAHRRYKVLVDGSEEPWLADVPDGAGTRYASGDKVSVGFAGEPSWVW